MPHWVCTRCEERHKGEWTTFHLWTLSHAECAVAPTMKAKAAAKSGGSIYNCFDKGCCFHKGVDVYLMEQVFSQVSKHLQIGRKTCFPDWHMWVWLYLLLMRRGLQVLVKILEDRLLHMGVLGGLLTIFWVRAGLSTMLWNGTFVGRYAYCVVVLLSRRDSANANQLLWFSNFDHACL